MKKFKEIFRIEENLHIEGSPLVIKKGLLLEDNQTGLLEVQIRLKNVSLKNISSATIEITPYDVDGCKLKNVKKHHYSQLSVNPGDEFGGKTLIHLSKDGAASFNVTVTSVTFSDTEEWAAPAGAVWKKTYDAESFCNHSPQTLAKKTSVVLVCLLILALALGMVIVPCMKYIEAQSLLEQNRYDEADVILTDLGNYKDSRKVQQQAREEKAEKCEISAGWGYTAYLKTDGTVETTGINRDGQCDSSDWLDIVDISAGRSHTTGLKGDGTVVAVGDNDDGRCNVSAWKDIVAVEAGGGHTVGLKSDGTVLAVGNNDYGQCDVQDWNDIIAISAGIYHTVGLKSDGTVLAAGFNKYGQCDVDSWEDIISVSAGGWHTVGLKSDSTAVASGYNRDGRCDVEQWSGLIAVSAGGGHTIGLKRDGRAVAAGSNNNGRADVGSWTDIVSVSAGSDHTVAIKKDSTIISVGNNEYGQCNVDRWNR